MKGLVSVIMPVYNAATTLPKSIGSLLAQTYRCLELIFVDDCSCDGSIEIINGYKSEADKLGIKMKLVSHTENKGVAAARNAGLDIASGEFVYWLDADDTIDPPAIGEMVMLSESGSCDIIGIEWNLTFMRNERAVSQPDVRDGKELFGKFASGICRWNLWLFMVRRELIEKNALRFIPGKNMGEDMMFMSKVSLLAGNVSIIHKPYYHYWQNEATLSGTWDDNKRDQVSANVFVLEEFIRAEWNERFDNDINRLKLTVKLPLLISSSKNDYETWLNWFPESNSSVAWLEDLPVRTRFIQKAAFNRHFWVLKIYNFIVKKIIYGILYR